MPGPSQIANQTLLPQSQHQPPQQPAPTDAPPSINISQIPPPTILLTEKVMFMRTLSEIFRKKGLTGEDIPKHNGVGIDLFLLFREVIQLGGRDVVGQTPGGWERIAIKFGVFQEVYMELLGDMEDIFRNGILLAKQHHAQNQARQQHQQQGQAQNQPQDQAQRQGQGQAYSHHNQVPHRQQPSQPAPPRQQPSAAPNQMMTGTQPQTQHAPLLHHQQPTAQQSQPRPSQQQQPVNRPGGQGVLSRATGVLGSTNISVPQPPMHLTGHQVINVARVQKRAEEARQLKAMLKAQAPRHRAFLSSRGF